MLRAGGAFMVRSQAATAQILQHSGLAGGLEPLCLQFIPRRAHQTKVGPPSDFTAIYLQSTPG